MNIAKKLEYVQQGIRNIATHDDADSVVRLAALTEIETSVQAEREALTARVNAEVAEAGLPARPKAE